jgi:hypothetical protein
VTTLERPARSGDPKPILDGQRAHGESALVYVFVVLPMLALLVEIGRAHV